MRELSCEYLRELLHYDAETGVFIWKVDTQNHRTHAGDQAGWLDCRNPNHPNRYIIISGKRYLDSRLAWLWMTGHWPEHEIDHCNCDSSDNRWINLRLATHAQNVANQRKRSNNRTGFKGVHAHGKRFRAQFRFNGVQKHLGIFDTAEEAAEAYRRATIIANGEFARYA